MQDAHHSLDSARARPIHRLALSALLGLAVGCSDDPVSVPGAAPLQPQASTVLEILQGLGLESLAAPVPTYYSAGHRERAESLQTWLRGADAFFQRRLRIAPPWQLAVLSPEDWAAITPGPYGVPFVTDAYRLVVLPAVPELAVVTQVYSASEGALPPDAAADLAALGVSYADAVRQVTDLIGFHEVGHVYIAELGYHKDNTARWFEELLATYAAYSYLDVAHPASITIWNALSEALLGFVQPSSRSLDDFNTLYIQGLGPVTYGWFQSHFNLRDDDVVRQRPRATWFAQLAAHGLDQDTRAIPTSELLNRLRGFMPGFRQWADAVGLEYE
jgi:hypothetical protein